MCNIMVRTLVLSVILMEFSINNVSSQINSTLTIDRGIFTTTPRYREKEKKRKKGVDMSAEKRLVNHLLDNYARIRQDGRPVQNDSTSVPVSFGLGLVQMELNEKDAVLILSMWTRYQWHDDYLTWDPDEYNSVSGVNLDPLHIWSPDIMLYNTADVAIEQREALAVVRYDGTVSWYPHSIFRATCSIDIANYPFDEQKCYLAFGSWTHNSKEIDLDMGFPGGIDLSTFNNDAQDSSSWQILNVTARKNYMPSEEEDPNFAVLTFELHIRRRVVFSSYILTLPCIFLASLTLVVFWLPPERPDRIGLAMAVFSSFMVLLLILVEAAPPTAASVPKLGMYYCFNMVIIVMAVIISAAIVNISRGCKGKPVSKCLQCVTLALSNMLCIPTESLRWCCCPKRGGPTPEIPLVDEPASCMGGLLCTACDCLSYQGNCNSKKNRMAEQNGLTANAIRLAHPVAGACNGQCKTALCDYCSEHENLNDTNVDSDDGMFIQSPSTSAAGDMLYEGMKAIRRTIDKYENCQAQEASRARVANFIAKQWKETAHVLDRFLFVVYLVLIMVSLGFFFPKPHTD